MNDFEVHHVGTAQYMAELERDAARYREIRAGLAYIEPTNGEGNAYEIYVAATERGVYCHTPQEFDAAIDAAMGEAK